MDEIDQGNALIRILHWVDPVKLTDEEWAQRVADSHFFLKVLTESLFGRGSHS